MSQRTAMIEEEFDDDTDLPLPSFIPNAGTRGPILQQIDDGEMQSDSDDDERQPGPASFSAQPRFAPQARESEVIHDNTPFKSWTCVYPIYLDAKRPYGTGERRISRAKSVWWPLSKDIAQAAARLRLPTVHEVNKSHPRDWENPGRVRIQWKEDGKFTNPAIKTKKQLLEMISLQIQLLKPENVPKPPYTLSSSGPPVDIATADPDENAATSQTASSKGKQPANSSGPASAPSTPAPKPSSRQKGQTAPQQQKKVQKPAHRPLPVPPLPYPPLSNRLSSYSPAVATGMLVETVKASMNAPAEGAIPGVPPAAAANIGKGKRKVVRVRA